MKTLILAIAALALATPVLAQAPVAEMAKAGKILRDSAGATVGRIDRVEADGTVKVIFDSRVVAVPADSIKVVDGQASTTLTKREVGRLR